MSHSDLDALDNFLDKKEKEEEIEWDLEDMKKSIIDSAEQSRDKYAGGGL